MTDHIPNLNANMSGHSCSCHARDFGACFVCVGLECDYWFNDDAAEVLDTALPRDVVIEVNRQKPEEKIDYKTLLVKYIEHVKTYEGADALDARHAYPDMPIFTNEEWSELLKLREEPYEGQHLIWVTHNTNLGEE